MKQCTANGKPETGRTLLVTEKLQTLVKPCRKRDLPCRPIQAEAGVGNGAPETIEKHCKNKLFGHLDRSANLPAALCPACDPGSLADNPMKIIENPWKNEGSPLGSPAFPDVPHLAGKVVAMPVR